MSDFIWVEKYRPKTIDDCILPDSIKKTFKDFLNRGEIPNMLLAGRKNYSSESIMQRTRSRFLCHQRIR